MEKNPILFIAENGCHDVSEALSLRDEKIEMCSFREASSAIYDYKTDLMILDCGFESDKGIHFLRKIKDQRPDIPVIFISDPIGEKAIQVYKLGARDYFPKPVNIFELEDVIEGLLRAKRNSKEKRAPLLASGNGKKELPEIVSNDKPANLIEVMNFIQENLSQRITLDQLARIARLSKFHFCRFFEKHTGLTPMKFVKNARVEKAKTLIKKGKYNMISVAIQSGFTNSCTFSKQFKKNTGVSPSSYQRLEK